MNNIITFSRLRSLLAMLLLVAVMANVRADEIPPAVTIPTLTDLAADLRLSRESTRPVMLIFSAEHCYYCKRLKESVVKPMLRSGDYDHRVIIRLLEIDDRAEIRGLDGKDISPSALANHYKVRFTPTVILLGPEGTEIGERQLGINNEDYYGVYLDKEIEKGIARIKAGKQP